MIKKAFLSVWMALFALAASAQEVEMADIMRSNGKIYVVVSVIVIIFLGLILYLIRIEKKLNKLEKEKEDYLSDTAG